MFPLYYSIIECLKNLGWYFDGFGREFSRYKVRHPGDRDEHTIFKSIIFNLKHMFSGLSSHSFVVQLRGLKTYVSNPKQYVLSTVYSSRSPGYLTLYLLISLPNESNHFLENFIKTYINNKYYQITSLEYQRNSIKYI